MPTQVQFRRGTTAQNAGFTGANGEISIDTSKKTIIVHDGSTPGGFPLAPNTAYDKANDAYSLANAAYVYANTIVGESTNLIPVFAQANSAFDKANSANVLAFTSGVLAGDAYNKANAANVLAFTSEVLAAAAFGKANSANVLAYDTGIGANNYAGLMANASNVYAETIGVNANTFANTKLANTTATFDGTLTVNNTILVKSIKGPFTDDTDASSNGSVALKEFYYDSTGTVKIRLV